MNVQRIPLSPAPQRFTITLAAKTYRLRLRWCWPMQAWFIDLEDGAGAPIVQGIPLVTGTDLLEQYQYLALGFALLVQSDHDADAPPTANNLGLTSNLYVIAP